jgi:large subunit ribosomal protein L29
MASYREMSVEELREEENQIRTSLFNLRLGNTTKELENTARIKATKKELARVLTELSARRKASAGQEAKGS